MSTKHSDIKLFGRTITSLFSVNHYDPSSPVHGASDHTKEDTSSSSSSCSPSTQQDKIPDDYSEQEKTRIKDPYTLTDLNQPPQLVSNISSQISSKTNCDQQSEITTSTSGDKSSTTLKKPDQILPCPRCESANTKFCYYNNYNVNQPRYFCRNCQRYWTAGGSMRNVPVGSGRRKNKGWPSSNSYLQVTSDDFRNINYINNNRTILSFGSSESSIKNQSEDTKIGAETPSQENKDYKVFLPPQVISPNNFSPWPYQCNPIPFYWGCMVPSWPTSQTSPSLGKRSRDHHQASLETEGRINDTTTTTTTNTTTRARLVSESLRVNSEPITKRPGWSKLPTKPEKKTEGFSLFNGFETKVSSNKRSLVPETSLINLQANPAAMSRSMNFRENNMQQ